VRANIDISEGESERVREKQTAEVVDGSLLLLLAHNTIIFCISLRVTSTICLEGLGHSHYRSVRGWKSLAEETTENAGEWQRIRGKVTVGDIQYCTYFTHSTSRRMDHSVSQERAGEPF